jgi:hypothetical protein
LESTRYVDKEAKIFEFKGLTGKILKTKEIGFPQDPFPVQSSVNMVWPADS